jgi:UDP-N-acetylglucosamine 2-epimerase (non-hydrolysing)|tara:strand:- start:3900 stop:4979 length:1080 start_codon:yes stop_codon:yes gene_type:complete
MSKILTLIGTRPEIIRLSKIINILDKTNKNILVHTGQNYDYNLDKIFFKDLNVRKPNYYLGAKGSFAEQLSIITLKLEKIILKEKPSKFVVLGDTNSSLGAIIAKRLNLQVYHLEAGNRSFIKKSPEEINRKIIDHISDINMPYTYRSCENLVKEGIKRQKIFVIGNPIFEVINTHIGNTQQSKILKKLKMKTDLYILCTLHREENVDDKFKLKHYINLLAKFTKALNLPVIFSIHPRTRKKIKEFKISIPKKIILIDPIGFFDFLKLEMNSKMIITDSGTVQEEASILNKLCIVLRDATERPETLENGDTIIINKDKSDFIKIKKILDYKSKSEPILEYSKKNVSQVVSNIINSDLND